MKVQAGSLNIFWPPSPHFPPALFTAFRLSPSSHFFCQNLSHPKFPMFSTLDLEYKHFDKKVKITWGLCTILNNGWPVKVMIYESRVKAIIESPFPPGVQIASLPSLLRLFLRTPTHSLSPSLHSTLTRERSQGKGERERKISRGETREGRNCVVRANKVRFMARLYFDNQYVWLGTPFQAMSSPTEEPRSSSAATESTLAAADRENAFQGINIAI